MAGSSLNPNRLGLKDYIGITVPLYNFVPQDEGQQTRYI